MQSEVEFCLSVPPAGGDEKAFSFDYATVSSSVAKFLKGQADRIRRQCSASTIQIGRALLESKRHLSHGIFTKWVEMEVGIPIRTAQAYMRVAVWAADKGATVARLSPSALYLLSASNIPKEFVASILSRTEAGEHISPSVMRKELRTRRIDEEQDRACLVPMSNEYLIQTPVVEGLTELVSILIERLPPADFARVRSIMTSSTVVEDPNLGSNIELAFAARAYRIVA
jgi:hypothetical protein